METTSTINLLPELKQIVESVFSIMLSIEVEPVEEDWTPAIDRVTSTIQIGGSWRGVVVMEATRNQCCEYAAAMLGSPVPPSVTDDVRDAMGELVNMVGGNLKCTLAPGARLSLPFVIDGGDYRVRYPANASIQRQAFESAVGRFWVSTVTLPS